MSKQNEDTKITTFQFFINNFDEPIHYKNLVKLAKSKLGMDTDNEMNDVTSSSDSEADSSIETDQTSPAKKKRKLQDIEVRCSFMPWLTKFLVANKKSTFQKITRCNTFH